MNKFFIHHFGYTRQNMDENMRRKQEYYKKELANHGGANKPFDEKCRVWLEKDEKANEYLSVSNLGLPNVLTEHPMWQYYDEHMTKLECKNWTEDRLYKKILAEEQFGTMWLNQIGEAAPQIPYFHNEIKI
jgi:hypothetical protein